MKRIRGGSGLGDSLYVRPVADHFVSLGEDVRVMTNHPDVFIGSGVMVEKYSKVGHNVLAHYTAGKSSLGTTQWQDVCASANVGNLPLSFHWTVRNRKLINDLVAMANGKSIVMVNGGRPPMDRQDGYTDEMLPASEAFDAALKGLEGCFTVEVGKGTELYPLTACVDLANRTTVADLLDIAWVSDALIGQCSFMVPLAECFDKPLLAVWAQRGLDSRNDYIRQCTPQKILSKPSSRFVIDSWPAPLIEEKARALCDVR